MGGIRDGGDGGMGGMRGGMHLYNLKSYPLNVQGMDSTEIASEFFALIKCIQYNKKKKKKNLKCGISSQFE